MHQDEGRVKSVSSTGVLFVAAKMPLISGVSNSVESSGLWHVFCLLIIVRVEQRSLNQCNE